MSKERLQKVLSQAGLGSRREMERCIEAGLAKINSQVAKIGASVEASDRIFFRGSEIANPLAQSKKPRILIYHKPIGEISSRSDPKHAKTVFDKLPSLRQGRWVQVGRLDINTAGLMIFTTDGELANRLMHPRYQQEREYAVRVHGRVREESIKILQTGVELEDGMAKFAKIEFRGGEGANLWYHVVIMEGRNREVRRLWESQGYEVSRLIRIRYGNISLPRSLGRGEYRELGEEEVEHFMSKL